MKLLKVLNQNLQLHALQQPLLKKLKNYNIINYKLKIITNKITMIQKINTIYKFLKIKNSLKFKFFYAYNC